jgi:secretion/DNA translocation related TadE-like protein
MRQNRLAIMPFSRPLDPQTPPARPVTPSGSQPFATESSSAADPGRPCPSRPRPPTSPRGRPHKPAAGSDHARPRPAQPVQVPSDRARPDQAQPRHVRPDHAQPDRTEPGRARSRRRERPDHRDRGSGTILFLALAGVAFTLMTVTLGLGLAVSTRHRAAAAADLAALAAVDSPEGCSAAVRVAGANRARLSKCEFLADGTVLVSVVVDEPRLPEPVLGSAHAGPGPAQIASTRPPGVAMPTRRTGPEEAGGCGLSTKLVTPSGRCGPLE